MSVPPATKLSIAAAAGIAALLNVVTPVWGLEAPVDFQPLPCDGSADGTCGSDGALKLLQVRADRRQSAHNRSLQVGFHKACDIEEEAGCPLFALNGPTLVYPGGDTKCINGDEYAFAVTPGDKDKLLLYFQGGGACWEANGLDGKQVVFQCTDSMQRAAVTSGLGLGFQNRDDEANPFRKYTVVEVLYCSGDAFMGDSSIETQGVAFPQKGLANAQAAADWVQQSFAGDDLATFVIAGYSAGSLGVAAWSAQLLDTMRYRSASVVMDSYVGLFPPGTQGPTLKRWGVCGSNLWADPGLEELCNQGALTIQEVLEASMKRHPEIPFAAIQSKADDSQIRFYRGMAKSWGLAEEMKLPPSQFYAGVNRIIERYELVAPNYVVYLVDGSRHGYTDSPDFFRAHGYGLDAPQNGVVTENDAGQPLAAWVRDLISGRPTSSVCTGPEMEGGPDDGVEYCSAGVLSRGAA